MGIQLLRDSRFNAFFWTQFLGAFNDNLLKFAVILAVTYNDSLRGNISTGLLINLVSAVFILPFFLFSATSGQLADKFDKTRVMRLAKYLEPPIVLITALGFLANSVVLLVLAVFLLGAQSAFFGPAKYAYLPEHLLHHELVKSNALVESATFIAILSGTIAAGALMSKDAQDYMEYVVCGFGLLVALAGVYQSKKMPLTPSHNPSLQVNWNVFTETWRNIHFAKQLKAVWPVLLGISWLWFVGATYLTQFPLLTKTLFYANTAVATVLLSGFTGGLGLGAFLCERWSHKRIEMGLVLWGLLTMVVAGVLLHIVLGQYQTPRQVQDLAAFFSQLQNWFVLFLFIAISAGVGLYSVPLYTSMQVLSPQKSRSRVVSANNIVNSFFMVVSAGFSIAVLIASQGMVVWVFSAVTLLNIAVLALWCIKQPHVLLRARLLFKVPLRHVPRIENLDELNMEGGNVLVFPTLLHDEYLQRLSTVPLPIAVVLSGHLHTTRFVAWLRKHEFVFEFNKLSEVDSQKALIQRIAVQMQKKRSIAIDLSMFELLKKQYRLTDLPAVMARKGIHMQIVEFKMKKSKIQENSDDFSPPIWCLKNCVPPPING